MGRVTRSSIPDKENTPLRDGKTRLRSGKAVSTTVTPRKPLGDINRNIASTPRTLTPGKKIVKKRTSKAKSTDIATVSKDSGAVTATAIGNPEESRHQVAVVSDKPAFVKTADAEPAAVRASVAEATVSGVQQPEGSVGVSSRPPCCQHLSNVEWECLQMTAGPDDIAFWWRAAEERREALQELITENITVHQQNKELKQEIERLQSKESEAHYFKLMAHLWELQSSSAGSLSA